MNVLLICIVMMNIARIYTGGHRYFPGGISHCTHRLIKIKTYKDETWAAGRNRFSDIVIAYRVLLCIDRQGSLWETNRTIT